MSMKSDFTCYSVIRKVPSSTACYAQYIVPFNVDSIDPLVGTKPLTYILYSMYSMCCMLSIVYNQS